MEIGLSTGFSYDQWGYDLDSVDLNIFVILNLINMVNARMVDENTLCICGEQ